MIEGIIKGQELRIVTPTIASDTINYLTGRFRFSPDWSGVDKWVHFEQGSNNYVVKLTNDEITADAGVNLTYGKWSVYLHGNRFEGGEVTERITTEVKEICVKRSGVEGGDPFPEADPSEIERINAELEAVKAGKMEYYILTFDGTVLKHNGETQTFAQIREKCLDTKNFVYAQYANRLYIPAYVSASNIFFEATYIQSDVPKMNRIGISASNTITVIDMELPTVQQLNAVSAAAVKTVNHTAPDADGNVNVQGGGGGGIEDVKINNTSVVADGVASFSVSTGLGMTGTAIHVTNASDAQITARTSFRPITGANFDFAVKAAMTDGLGSDWTEEQQRAAQQRLGILSVEEVLF